MTELILVRHGQSMGNLERRFLGHTDLPLSPLGVEQARRLAEYLKDERVDAIYTSDLVRASATAAPIAMQRGIQLYPDPELREIYAGEWEGRGFDYLTAHYGASYATFRKHIGLARPDGGESTHEVGERVFAEVLAIAKRHDGQTVLVSTHATAICMFACRVLGLTPMQAEALALPTNASVSRFVFDGERFILRRYSEDAYLGDAKTLAPPLA